MTKLTDYITDEQLLAGMRRVGAAVEQISWLDELADELIAILYGEGAPAFWSYCKTKRDAVEEALGEDADCYLAYVFERAFPKLLAIYEERGYPMKVLADTLADFDVRAANHRGLAGRAGMDDYNWTALHMTATIFTLGRLQYIFYKNASYGGRIYRHRKTGELVVVAEEGLAVDDAGFRVIDGEAFRTMLVEANGFIEAHPIDNGNVLRERTRLDVSEYECVLRDGDPVIDIHIPASGKLDMEACHASLKEAWAFGKRYFPERDYRGFICLSWLLGDEIAESLSPDSNLARFARLFTRCASYGNEHPLIYPWIFGMDKKREAYREHEATTSIQRGARRLLDEGRWYRDRGGVILPDQLGLS